MRQRERSGSREGSVQVFGDELGGGEEGAGDEGAEGGSVASVAHPLSHSGAWVLATEEEEEVGFCSPSLAPAKTLSLSPCLPIRESTEPGTHPQAKNNSRRNGGRTIVDVDIGQLPWQHRQDTSLILRCCCFLVVRLSF